jgi:hypothetical protein
MGAWSVPTLVEARMAERLREAEHVRLARSASGVRLRRTADGSAEPGTRRASRRLSIHASPIIAALVGSLIVGGIVLLVDEVAAGGAVAAVPAPVTMAPADVSGEWLYLPDGLGIGRLSDARVSGTGWHTFAAPPNEAAGTHSGDFVLEGPDGQWVGHLAATWAACLCEAEVFTGTGQVLGVEGVIALEGTGAYEGWSFVGTWTDPMTGAPAQVRGRIDGGQAPRIADLAWLGQGETSCL